MKKIGAADLAKASFAPLGGIESRYRFLSRCDLWWPLESYRKRHAARPTATHRAMTSMRMEIFGGGRELDGSAQTFASEFHDWLLLLERRDRDESTSRVGLCVISKELLPVTVHFPVQS